MLKPQTRCCCSQMFRSNKMEVWDDVKCQRAGAQIQFSTLVLRMVTVLLLILGGSFNVVSGQTPAKYYEDDLRALQAIWGAWNQSTHDAASNLAGWSSKKSGNKSTEPCHGLFDPKAKILNWRGVFCLKMNHSALSNDPNVEIIGLKLQIASIGGTLPKEIGDLHSLTTLELTGNTNLTGPLPGTLPKLLLNILDVHDNGFNGSLPDSFGEFRTILEFDVSGNKFTGGYPFLQTSSMDYLQKLFIARNQFGGELPEDAFKNKTQLERLDISDNKFNGTLPPLDSMIKFLHYLDVSRNQFEGNLPDLTSFQVLRHVNLGSNNFIGTAELTNFLKLQNDNDDEPIGYVDLSYNNLNGPLPLWTFLTLGSIQELYLDNNKLSGTLDVSLMFREGLLKIKDLNSADNSTHHKLRIMSLINNRITDVIYDPYIVGNVTTLFKLQGNPYCKPKYDPGNDGQRCFCTQVCFVTSPKTDSHRNTIIAATTSVVGAALILLVVIGAILYKNRRYKQYLQQEFKQKFEEFDVKPTIFSYSELRAATRDFSEDMKLGQGAYGAVYKGVLPSGNVVAVKQLFVKAAQGMDDFLNEVVLITGMKHRNLVNLKGCCLRERQRLLVYEYVDNYDVEHNLFAPNREELTWPVRLKICLGIARGLHYLHSLAQPRVIHRDIKAGNVLLDSNMEPKIADFGLALLFPDEQSHIMTIHVAGTKGYLAPEYASRGQLSDKVDVFSFGVLCLEIISGRRNIDEAAPLDQVYLTVWAWHLHEQDRLTELVDPQLQLTDDEERDVERVINLCLLCIQNSAEKRPTMARIVSILQSDTESKVIVLGEGKLSSRRSLNSPRSNTSVEYVKTELGSVSEEGGSSSYEAGTPNVPSRARGRRGPSVSGANSVAVELSEIRAR